MYASDTKRRRSLAVCVCTAAAAASARPRARRPFRFVTSTTIRECHHHRHHRHKPLWGRVACQNGMCVCVSSSATNTCAVPNSCAWPGSGRTARRASHTNTSSERGCSSAAAAPFYVCSLTLCCCCWLLLLANVCAHRTRRTSNAHTQSQCVCLCVRVCPYINGVYKPYINNHRFTPPTKGGRWPGFSMVVGAAGERSDSPYLIFMSRTSLFNACACVRVREHQAQSARVVLESVECV